MSANLKYLSLFQNPIENVKKSHDDHRGLESGRAAATCQTGFIDVHVVFTSSSRDENLIAN